MIFASAVLSQYTRVTDDDDDRQTDRQHLMPTAELALQLQRSAKTLLAEYTTITTGNVHKSKNVKNRPPNGIRFTGVTCFEDGL